VLWFFGTSNATGIIIGNTIGEGDKVAARQYANAFAAWGPIMGFVVAVVFILPLSLIVPSFFNVSDSVEKSATLILFVCCASLPFKVFNWHMIVGVLRSGGDTIYAMALEGATMWLIGVPLAVVGGLVFHLPIYWVVMLIQLEEVAKLIFCLRRLKSGKWLHDITAATAEDTL
jgi:Na+-driven multidrug efflux pump